MDLELENKVKSCPSCQMQQDNPARAPLHPWEWPQQPWSKYILIMLDPFWEK